jgi:hypothetical protein
VEALKAEMQRDGDNLYTIPLTSTGYVRRDVKKVLRAWGRHRLLELFPDAGVYTLLREAFRGGNTHANRYFVKNPDYPLPPVENVHSADRSSSYPDVQVNYMFPMSPFRRVEKSVSYTELKDHYIKRRGYALIFRLQIDNLQLRDMFNPCPYISYDKARKVRGKVLDNGRLLGADHCEITVTDIDFQIIDKQYVLCNENTVITDLKSRLTVLKILHIRGLLQDKSCRKMPITKDALSHLFFLLSEKTLPMLLTEKACISCEILKVQKARVRPRASPPPIFAFP